MFKKSAYRIYFLEKRVLRANKKDPFLKKEFERFKKVHCEHDVALHRVKSVLKELHIDYTEAYRGHLRNFSKYDLIITVGGDGTFLEAARKSKGLVLLGVNSVPHHSVGHFCLARVDNFKKIMGRILAGRYRLIYLQRLRLHLPSSSTHVDALNDILICHENPASLCRYHLKVGKREEAQRSSGLWIASAAGSTGAIHSAGGKKLPLSAKHFQYWPRELYQGLLKPYHLKGGILPLSTAVKVTSLMPRGMIFVDGAHRKMAFPFGRRAIIALSPQPIRTIKV